MRVVHFRREAYTHYIGRGPASIGLENMYVWKPSKVIGTAMVRDRAMALKYYEEDVRKDPKKIALIAALPEDAVLGCWCSPKPCHGDVIIKIWKELHAR